MSNDIYLEEKRVKLIKGLEESYRRLVEFKKYKKNPLVVSKHGKVEQICHEAINPETKYEHNFK